MYGTRMGTRRNGGEMPLRPDAMCNKEMMKRREKVIVAKARTGRDWTS